MFLSTTTTNTLLFSAAAIVIVTIITLLPLTNAAIIDKCLKNGQVAMTFDEGPSVNYTAGILAVLANKKVAATFHVVTQFFSDPAVTDLVKGIVAGNHILGYRSEPTWDLNGMLDEQLKGNISNALNAIEQATGKRPKFIRLPYNETTAHQNSVVESMGLILTAHNLDSHDYEPQTAGSSSSSLSSISSRVDASAGGGKPADFNWITVQRDFTEKSIADTAAIIDYFRSKGYLFVSLEECVNGGKAPLTTSPTLTDGTTATTSSTSTGDTSSSDSKDISQLASDSAGASTTVSYGLSVFLIVFSLIAYRFQSAGPQ